MSGRGRLKINSPGGRSFVAKSPVPAVGELFAAADPCSIILIGMPCVRSGPLR